MDQEGLTVTLADLQHHVVKYGLDVFPPIEVRKDVTRAHDLFQALQAEWPALYQELNFRPEANDFKVLASFRFDPGPIRIPTLVLTGRGPVFSFPLRLPPPLGEVEQKADLEDVFRGSLGLIHRTFPGLTVLRIGLVRELVFGTGKANSAPYLSSRYGTFPGAEARGGEATLAFQDDLCNIRVKIRTVEIRRQAQHRATKQVLADEMEYGLKVNFDVNNIEMRPQSASDIEMMLERARSMWPEDLLEFINWKWKETSE